nr:hypothetical protein OG690_38605 [Streptomyces tubercidicus]
MDRNVPLDPEITEPPAAAAKAGPAVDPYVIASAAEAAEANVDYAPAAEYFGRLLGGGR